MADSNKVVWSEGLFLRTQHFQQQDRHSEWLVRRALRATPLQSFGFTHLKLDESALEAGLVGVAAATGVFPDGSFFSIPDGTAEIAQVSISASTVAGAVCLGIPAERPGAALIDPAHAAPSGTRYRGEMITVRDEIRKGAEETEIEIAKLAPRLMLPGEDTAGFSTLPLAHVTGLNADGGL
jgi:type VI secretion system protein ImpJ